MTRCAWLSITVYAARYGVARGTVYKWLKAGLLEYYRVGRVVRIRNVPPNEDVTTRMFTDVDAVT